jgi:hypothetical protein
VHVRVEGEPRHLPNREFRAPPRLRARPPTVTSPCPPFASPRPPPGARRLLCPPRAAAAAMPRPWTKSSSPSSSRTKSVRVPLPGLNHADQRLLLLSPCSACSRCCCSCVLHVHRLSFRRRLPRSTCPPRPATWVSSRTTSRRWSPCARVSLRLLRTQAARPRSTSVRALLPPAQRGSLTPTTSRSVGRVPYCAPEQPPHDQRC